MSFPITQYQGRRPKGSCSGQNQVISPDRIGIESAGCFVSGNCLRPHVLHRVHVLRGWAFADFWRSASVAKTPRQQQSARRREELLGAPGCCVNLRSEVAAELLSGIFRQLKWLQASKRRPLSVSEKHQKSVDENYFRNLHIQALKNINSQIRNQMERNENDNYVEHRRFLRLLQSEQFELDMEEAIQKTDNSISFELRELEKKLKAAYMNKERAAQIAEKDAIKYEQMKRDAEIVKIMMAEQERVIKQENAAEEKRSRVKAQYYLDLEKQLEEQEKKKQEAYEQSLKEKLMIDEIVRKIYEEDQLEKQQKLEKKITTRRYIEEFQKEQALWRKKKREEMEEENRKIIEFANLKQQREEDRMAKIQENEEKRLQRQNELTQKLGEMLRQREDLEQVRQELYQEEKAELYKKELKEQAEEKLRKKTERKRDFEEQMALKALVLQAAQEEEESFRQALLAKLAEDDRIELMNAQKQRMKQLEHRRAVERLIEDRRNQFIADKVRDLGGLGVFKKEDDIDLLGEEFRKAYQKRSDISEEK
ncbi:meiosis-specific nuclear structural protein 1 [Otolemur garnettii]|uniref:meiosis-specific nuclear structural protein 1 n=1 Tax=Otolemur garnettii TaxID=30611 RepID=UPI0006446C80|nr:meiosis-specific nuclear structural protein 1 [Otolemur garnettii]